MKKACYILCFCSAQANKLARYVSVFRSALVCMRVGWFYTWEIPQGVSAPEAKNRRSLCDIRHFQEYPSKTTKCYLNFTSLGWNLTNTALSVSHAQFQTFSPIKSICERQNLVHLLKLHLRQSVSRKSPLEFQKVNILFGRDQTHAEVFVTDLITSTTDLKIGWRFKSTFVSRITTHP